MVKKTLIEKNPNGIRPGIKKEEILKLTPEEKKYVQLRRDCSERFVKNKDAYQCAMRTDQMYQEFNKSMSALDTMLFSILSAKTKIDKNNILVNKGDINKLYPGTQITMTKTDLEVENINANKLVYDGIGQLWCILADIYRYIGLHRVDGEVFFTEEQYQKKVDYVKSSLKKLNLELFRERW